MDSWVTQSETGSAAACVAIWDVKTALPPRDEWTEGSCFSDIMYAQDSMIARIGAEVACGVREASRHGPCLSWQGVAGMGPKSCIMASLLEVAGRIQAERAGRMVSFELPHS